MSELDAIVSPQYREVLQRTHAGVKGWGGGGKYWIEITTLYAAELGATSILDFGCGQGVLKQRLNWVDLGLDVREYDPGIPGKDMVPEPADLVICTDVLEHVEPDKLDVTGFLLRKLARKGAFFLIACSPAKMKLADGRNAHLSLHDPDWWAFWLTQKGFEIQQISGKSKGVRIWAR